MDVNEGLRKAAAAGDEAELKAFLQEPGCDALSQDRHGVTALMWAVGGGHEGCVRLLLPVSDALSKDRSGMTALMWAKYNKQEACLGLLLAANHALSKDNNGTTALMWAAYRGHEACVGLLLPLSDALAKNKDGRTASGLARNNEYESLARFIDAYALALKELASIGEASRPGITGVRTSMRM